MSPSSYKPRLLVEHLRAAGLPLDLHEPPALSVADLCRAHHPEYVNNVLACVEMNGFGNLDPDVARTLPYTSGSMYLAACLALEHGLAASFTSGFHHARYQRGGGFCTFNGLVATALRLHHEGRIGATPPGFWRRARGKTLILDLDYHYGDGTDDIIRQLELKDWIAHESFGDTLKLPHQSGRYLDRLRSLLKSLSQDSYDLILYQAGADVHVDDPLGGLLTTPQMQERDRMVFEACRRRGIPLAWNLAGGYQRDENDSILPVLRLHEQTYREALGAYGAPQSLGLTGRPEALGDV